MRKATIKELCVIADALNDVDKPDNSDGGYVQAESVVYVPGKGCLDAALTLYDGYPEHGHLAIFEGSENIVPDNTYLLHDVLDYFQIPRGEVFPGNWYILTAGENLEDLDGGPQDNERIQKAIGCLKELIVKSFTFEKGVNP